MEQSVRALAGRNRKLAVLGSSVLVLILGLWLRPATAPHQDPVEQAPAPILRELVQPADAANPFREARRMAERAVQATVAFRSVDPENPNASVVGVVVGPAGALIVHSLAFATREATGTLADGREVSAVVEAFDRESHLVLARLKPPLEPVRRPAQAAAPGDLLFAIGRTSYGLTIDPTFVTAASGDALRLASWSRTPLASAPVFTANGECVAIASDSASSTERLSASIERLTEAASRGSRIPSTIGVEFQDTTEPLAAYFGRDGVIVSGIVTGGPAEAAGLRPGDLIVALNGESVTTVAGLASQIESAAPDAALRLSLLRERRQIDTMVTPVTLLAAQRLSGARAGRFVGTAPADELFQADVLDRAGIGRDATILSVNHQPPSRRRPSRTELVYFEEKGRRQFTVIEGSR